MYYHSRLSSNLETDENGSTQEWTDELLFGSSLACTMPVHRSTAGEKVGSCSAADGGNDGDGAEVASALSYTFVGVVCILKA